MSATEKAGRPSDDEVDAAGELLRSPLRLKWHPTAIEEAAFVVERWRRAHQGLISRFQPELQRIADSAGVETTIAARLKRFPTIEDKLTRFPNLRLSTFQDIGGSRVIVKARENVLALARAIPSRMGGFERIDSSDYMARPKKTGYGGLHLIWKSIEHLLRPADPHEWSRFRHESI